MYTVDSKILAKAIDEYCSRERVSKKDFYTESGISSATLTQWRKEEYLVSARSIAKLEKYLGMSLEGFIGKYLNADQNENTDRIDDDDRDVMELREELRRRPETKILFHASKNAPASAILEAAALIERYKEESKYK